MKKGSFELGGSDPFIVLENADIDLAVEKAVIGRMICNGQACNNAKRFIIHEKVYN
jgi:succinate-semialdehyde dehydrogenase/glutarate-semialdehyde dehydrogenase